MKKVKPSPVKALFLDIPDVKAAPKHGDLRGRAEKELAVNKKGKPIPSIDAIKLVHELQVHQIELEMQNEELQLARTAMEESRARFSDLYDFAPVGYVTLDDKGTTLEANLTMSRLTGFDRGFLLNKPFLLFVAKEDKDVFSANFKLLIDSNALMTLEVRLVKKDKSVFYAQFESIGFKEKVKFSQQYFLAIFDVTKRWEAEKALEESEKNYRQIVELAQEGIWVIDDKNLTTFVNPALELMLGYAHGTMVGKHLFDFRDEREIELTKQSLERRKKGIRERRDMELIHADGSRIYTTMAASPIMNDKDGYLGAVAVITDITKRKKMEDEIRRNEARLESLLKISQHKAESGQDLLDFALDEAINLTKSKIGYIYYYDDMTKEFTLNTWSKGVMSECTIVEKQTKYLLEKTGIWGEAVRQAGPIIVNDFHAPNPLKKGYPEGHAALHKFLTIPIILEGRIVGVVGVANKKTDYTHNDALQLNLLMASAWMILEQKRMENLLRRSEERFRNLFESMDEGFALCKMIDDETGKPVDFSYIEVNPAFARLTGLPVERVIGHRVKEVIPGIEPFWIETYGRIVESGKAERVDNPVADLEKHYEVYAWRSSPGHFAAVFNDITGRKQAEKLLKAHTEELAFANKELEAFGYSVSHDLRNPINSIRACLEAIAVDSESTLGKNSITAMGYITRSIGEMSRIITDLLALSKVTRMEVQREKIDLSEIVSQIYSELKSSDSARDLDFAIQPDCIINADKGLMKIMLGNLIGNAWKYTGPRKKAFIEFGLQSGPRPATYFIRDNGVGFDLTKAGLLFQPFQRLHSSKEFSGTGIGLSIVKRVIEKHGGSIWAESEKDKGATFFFRLE